MCVCSIYTHTYTQSIYFVALMLQLEAHQKSIFIIQIPE